MPLILPEDFLSFDENAWLEAVDRALKGAPRSRLTGRTDDGLEIQPLYPQRSEARPLATRKAQTPWAIIQRIDLPNPSAANAQILEDLKEGAEGIEVVLATSTTSGGQGVRVDDLSGMEQLFDGVLLDLIRLRLGAGHETSSIVTMLLAYAERKDIDPAKLQLSAGLDLFGWVARRGQFRSDFERVEERIFDLLHFLKGQNLKYEFFCADGRVWHGAGATPAQELACAFANALYCLRFLERAGIDPAEWSDWINFTLVADADQVGTIAKARAARRIWARILDACGLPQKPMSLHMTTSRRMLTANDPWVNLLRTTVAAFSAGVGGADSVTVLPFTMAMGLPDGFARRLARNTQSMLIEESNLHQVADPSAGSGAIEARTDGLVEAAWAQLQEIEAEGGIWKSLVDGKIQNRIAVSLASLQKAVATRKKPITGVSEFPDLKETPVAVLDDTQDDVAPLNHHVDLPPPGEGKYAAAMKEAFLGGSSLAVAIETRPHADNPVRIDKVPQIRLSEPFEELREAAAVSRAGTPPVVFLACLGPLAQFTARATWTSNVFAAGGVASVGGEAHSGLDELVAAFKASGAKLAVLVSSDTIYESDGETAARALKEAGADYLYLAGKPGAMEEKLRAAGVDTFVFAGCDVLELLREAQGRIGLVDIEEVPA
ncbi:methylmalonyl-CoA mutase family protein [uncultured Roseibium sp.]|uniref:methylmalonyl-CoA mutase family protein n=1 Tax=uncultured Roseibium sp. TaxID=1936171 RepID=UPI0032162DA7